MKRGIYDADHESFRASVRSLLDRAVRPSGDRYLDLKPLPREMWPTVGGHGLLGLQIPEQYAGSAAGDFRYNAVLGELGKVSTSVDPATASTPTSSRDDPGEVGVRAHHAGPHGAWTSDDGLGSRPKQRSAALRSVQRPVPAQNNGLDVNVRLDRRSVRRTGVGLMALVGALLMVLWLFSVVSHFLFLVMLAWLFAISLEPGSVP